MSKAKELVEKYSPVREPITVKQLVEKLNTCNPDYTVVFSEFGNVKDIVKEELIFADTRIDTPLRQVFEDKETGEVILVRNGITIEQFPENVTEIK